MASFIAFGGVVIAVLIILFTLRALYVRRKATKRISKPARIDIHNLMDDIMERLPLSRGGHLWEVKVVDHEFKYTGSKDVDSKVCGVCNSTVSHTHTYPAIKVILKDLLDENNTSFTIGIFKWRHGLGSVNVVASSHESIVNAAVDRASTLPALYR